MAIVAMLMASLWLVGMSSPRGAGGMIHLLLVCAVLLLAYKVFEASRERRVRDVRWPPDVR